MKALVLAGGAGTHLGPITRTSARQLVPVANMPILHYGLEQIRDAGITDIGIIVGETHKEIRAAIGDGAALGPSRPTFHQPKPLGLAHAVLTAADFLGDDDFVMFLGDNLEAQLLLKQLDEPQRFEVAELAEDGSIARLVEKPEDPRVTSPWWGPTYSGRRSWRPHATSSPRTVASWRSPMRPSGCWSAATRSIARSTTAGGCTPTPRCTAASTARSTTSPRSSVRWWSRRARKSRGPTWPDPWSGAGSLVEDAYIGPFSSVAGACTVMDTESEYSIILERCPVVAAGRIEGSLLGRAVVAEGSSGKPMATRLMLGDHSHVAI